MHAEICAPVHLEKMAWSYRSKRTYSRSARRSFRRRRMARPRYRRRYGRGRRSRKTTSPIVKLSLDSTWSLRENGFNLWHPFAFIPTAIPGFTDYYSTYSHFRIVKAVLQISRQLQGVSNNGLLNHYLIVGSRPFVASTAPARLDVNTSVEYLAPGLEESRLRQARWQRSIYPQTNTSRVRAGFKPYTVVQTLGPTTVGDNVKWQRIWEGKRWMPFSWAWGVQGSTSSMVFYGPYCVTETPVGDVANTPENKVACTLTVYCQFRGQK